MEQYKVLTRKSILNVDSENEFIVSALIEEQNGILENAGIDINNDFYIVRFFDNAFRNESIESITIYDAVQRLAAKEGYDLVIFEGGHIGYISYYGSDCDGFEILTKDTVNS